MSFTIVLLTLLSSCALKAPESMEPVVDVPLSVLPDQEIMIRGLVARDIDMCGRMVCRIRQSVSDAGEDALPDDLDWVFHAEGRTSHALVGRFDPDEEHFVIQQAFRVYPDPEPLRVEVSLGNALDARGRALWIARGYLPEGLAPAAALFGYSVEDQGHVDTYWLPAPQLGCAGYVSGVTVISVDEMGSLVGEIEHWEPTTELAATVDSYLINGQLPSVPELAMLFTCSAENPSFRLVSDALTFAVVDFLGARILALSPRVEE